MKPEPIQDMEFYDPAEDESNVTDLFGDQPNVPPEASPRRARAPRKPPKPDVPGPKPKYGFEVIHLALDILSWKLNMLLCCGASAMMFTLAILWPDIQRLGAAAAFSVLVTAPVIYFYRKEST